MTTPAQRPNRLIQESSPYLLQHAYNPVDWFPWGEEAFQKARMEDKPIFLSIGYSTCHWCHVMEAESFEDPDVADYLNQHYICIKVDREERPDIDSIYMQICQAATGSGGWPLTIFMNWEQKPFYTGTYFPKERKYGHPGLLELLHTMITYWVQKRETLLEAGNTVLTALETYSSGADTGELPEGEVIEQAVAQLVAEFDETFGGFGSAPKFPSPHILMFLLRHFAFAGNLAALEMVERTLQQMYRGGIFDHIGGGFSRYATDDWWLVPHFEKMLYDNALLVMTLTETWQATGKAFYQRIAEETLAYIQREMTHELGGFYSAQDADAGGKEGEYYTFTPDEITEVLGETEGAWFCRYFDITPEGNFEGKNIPNLIQNEAYAEDLSQNERLFQKLRTYRYSRMQLHKDDKILTSWNAMMIIAYSKAYRAFRKPGYLQSAETAFQFIQTHMTDGEGRLGISWREETLRGKGILDDYAYMCWACLELYEATLALPYLQKALAYAEQILAYFADPKGGYYLDPVDGETLLFRPKEQYDGAVPSGNSVVAYCLTRIALLTGEAKWQTLADAQLAFYRKALETQPRAYTMALMGLMHMTFETAEILGISRQKEEMRELVWMLGEQFIPGITVLYKTVLNNRAEEKDALSAIAPFTAAYQLSPEYPRAFYYCKNKACQRPVHTIIELKERLAEN